MYMYSSARKPVEAEESTVLGWLFIFRNERTNERKMLRELLFHLGVRSPSLPCDSLEIELSEGTERARVAIKACDGELCSAA
jgi:hypothetical protein